MPTTRAKFTCNAIERTMGSRQLSGPGEPYKAEPAEMQTIKLNPVYGNGDPEHENTKFWQASPSGSIHLSTINAAAAAVFEIGKEYYVDFTPAS